ncbi:hypothetical protein HHI36_002680, partial [Cryptolaemus montrouzieri]
MVELTAITKNLKEFAVEFYGEKIHDLERKLKDIDVFDKKQFNLEMATLRAENIKVKNEMNAFQQAAEMNDVDVEIPERKNESNLEVVKEVS